MFQCFWQRAAFFGGGRPRCHRTADFGESFLSEGLSLRQMVQSARSILLKNGLCRADLHVNYRQVMTPAVVYFACEPIALFSGRQIFNLCRALTPPLGR